MMVNLLTVEIFVCSRIIQMSWVLWGVKKRSNYQMKERQGI